MYRQLQITLDLDHPHWQRDGRPARVARMAATIENELWEPIRTALLNGDAASGYFRSPDGDVVGEWRLTK